MGKCGIELFWGTLKLPTGEEVLYKAGVLLYNAVYSLIVFLYNLFFAISSAKVFKAEDFEKLFDTIASILGIVMLFFVTFSLFKMLFEPNMRGESAKSGKQLATDIITTIIMLVIVSTVFSTAKEFQNAVLTDEVIPKIFFPDSVGGSDGTTADEKDVNMKTAGNFLAATLLKAFYLPKLKEGLSSQATLNYTDTLTFEEGEGGTIINPMKFEDIYKRVELEGPEFLGTLDCPGIKDGVTFFWPLLFISCLFVIWALFVYSMDMAIRVVKLVFYQLIAPIPIALRIIPKQKEVFKKWLKNTVSTYADVFVRLIIIMFVVYMLRIIAGADFTTMWTDLEDSERPGPVTIEFAKILILLGVVWFLFLLPKIIADIFGTASGEDLGLGLGKVRKRAHEVRGVATPLAGAKAGLNQFKENYAKSRENDKGRFSSLLSGLAGGASASARASSNYLARGQRFGDSVANAQNTAAGNRDYRAARNRAIHNIAQQNTPEGITPDFGDIMRARLQARFGSKEKKAEIDKETKLIEAAMAAGANVSSLVAGSPGIEAQRALVARLEAAQAAQRQLNATQNIANNDRKVDAEAELAKTKEIIAAATAAQTAAQNDTTFGAQTREVDGSGNVITKTRNFENEGQAQEYIKDEQKKAQEASNRADAAKDNVKAAESARDAQRNTASEAQNALNAVNSNPKSTSDEKVAAEAKLNDENKKLVDAENNVKALTTGLETERKTASIHQGNVQNAQYSLDNKDTIISDRQKILSTPASEIKVPIRETVASSLGNVSGVKEITGIGAAEKYASDQFAKSDDAKRKMTEVEAVIADIKDEGGRISDDIKMLDTQIAAAPAADKPGLMARKGELVTKLKGNSDNLSSSQSEYMQLANESEASWNNASSARQAVTTILEKRAVGGVSGSPLSYSIKKLDPSGVPVVTTISGVGMDEARTQISDEESKVDGFTKQLNGHQEKFTSNLAEKQKAQYFVAESEKTIQEQSQIISNLEAKSDLGPLTAEDHGKLITANAAKSSAEKQLVIAGGIKEEADKNIEEEQNHIAVISSKIDSHRGNIQSISSSINEAYKEKGIGAQAATITFTDTSVDNNGQVVQTEKRVIGIDAAKKAIEEASAKRTEAKAERDKVVDAKIRLTAEKNISGTNIVNLTDELQRLDQEIEVSRQDPTKAAETSLLFEKHGEVKVKLLAEKTAAERKEAEIKTVADQESRFTLEEDTQTEKISAITSSISNAVNDQSSHINLEEMAKELKAKEDRLEAIKAEEAAQAAAVESYNILVQRQEAESAKLSAMLDNVKTSRSSVLDPEVEKVNKTVKDFIKKRPDIAAELRDTYGIDIAARDIVFEDLVVQKEITRHDSSGAEYKTKATLLDWVAEASTRLIKESKNIDAIVSREKPKKETKPDKKDGGDKK